MWKSLKDGWLNKSSADYATGRGPKLEDRQCICNVTLGRVRETVVAVEKQ
jgi:hypothetical protein